jgi:hypothetical protein
MRRVLLFFVFAASGFAFSTACQAQSIPPINAKALDDSHVVLPPADGKQLLILVVGFSHKSSEACGAWSKQLAADYASSPQAVYFQLAELQSAPSFVRGMILRGMHKDVAAAQQSHFVPLYDHEADWKALVHFSAADDPYVLLTSADGHVLWQTHGALSDSAYADLKAAVGKGSATQNAP